MTFNVQMAHIRMPEAAVWAIYFLDIKSGESCNRSRGKGEKKFLSSLSNVFICFQNIKSKCTFLCHASSLNFSFRGNVSAFDFLIDFD